MPPVPLTDADFYRLLCTCQKIAVLSARAGEAAAHYKAELLRANLERDRLLAELAARYQFVPPSAFDLDESGLALVPVEGQTGSG